ncbi:hypothetical protein AUC43_08400 [Hymenobacter sedentarius]|uniref:SHOCT domain-containing protein n=1 Tax=Hymenobacter sedentarius TaxID=1411621 RepID=A0A0U4ANK3_9BACT|nr:SHOCT domain-containing protein [Hymenobacter sedentarius]ALW85109.1 hypothetical protein AUC43_08400 [Hymenobacter sedentarius]
MENPSSPLDTLRQLKEMLDAGALTPSEFEALKQRLVFTAPSVSPPAPTATEPVAPAPVPAAPIAPVVPPLYQPTAPPSPPAAPPSPPAATQLPRYEDVPLNSTLSAGLPVSARAEPASHAAIPPKPQPIAPEPFPPIEPRVDADARWVANEIPEAEARAPRSPLALILSIGGLLAFLGLVMYLSSSRHPSERISSTSQTAADSLAAPAVETGPQAAPMAPQNTAAPETIRVRPTNPAPPVQRRPAAPVRDSAVVVPPAATAPADSAATP